jgi:nardilysin
MSADDSAASHDGSSAALAGKSAAPAGVQRAAAAMAVGVGSFSDPHDVQGLSHYLEHMLFMGSADFPRENEYDDYLTRRAGSSNAYTDAGYTNYHFDVEPRALRGALERFSGFFKAPLCLEAALEREVLRTPGCCQVASHCCKAML